ncbi:type II asparaginase [Granulicella sp. WH15]|nr:type II asparaginase [Granulicella sp. WH15]
MKDKKFLASRSLVLLLLIFSAVSACFAQGLPKVRLFSTGGTIQGSGPNRDEISNYKPGKISPKELLENVPEAKAVADLSYEEISSVGSGGVNTKILLKLAKAINAWLAQPDSAGAVVTHGTATMEETAYFLNLVVHSEKPVVVVGAMRPYTAISRDGPFNLYNAIRTAADPEARRKGVMVLLNEEIQAARDVTKTNTERVNTFESRDLGPIGFSDSDRIVFYRNLLYKHTYKSEFDVSKLDELPKVDIVYGYQEGERTAVDALIAAGAKGIVLDDSAPGFADAVKDGRAKGVVFVQSDRKGSGRVMEDPELKKGVVTADNLNAQKSRQLLRLALTKTTDIKEIQRMFDEY